MIKTKKILCKRLLSNCRVMQSRGRRIARSTRRASYTAHRWGVKNMRARAFPNCLCAAWPIYGKSFIKTAASIAHTWSSSDIQPATVVCCLFLMFSGRLWSHGWWSSKCRRCQQEGLAVKEVLDGRGFEVSGICNGRSGCVLMGFACHGVEWLVLNRTQSLSESGTELEEGRWEQHLRGRNILDSLKFLGF